MVISDLPIDSVEPFWALPDSIILGSPAFLLWDDFLSEKLQAGTIPQKKKVEKKCGTFLFKHFLGTKVSNHFSTPFTWGFLQKLPWPSSLRASSALPCCQGPVSRACQWASRWFAFLQPQMARSSWKSKTFNDSKQALQKRGKKASQIFTGAVFYGYRLSASSWLLSSSSSPS